MSKQTAMQQLLHQLREERTKLPMPIEWSRAYQAIEMMIQSTYIPMEIEQMIDCYLKADLFPRLYEFEKYYNETYGGGNNG